MTDRIMIVEDEPRLLEILCDYFRAKGAEPVPLSNGEQALRYLERDTVDAVLLDILMPEMDGFSVCRALRKNSSVPIIFLTALSDEEDKLYGYELGADDYVTKPFSLAVLRARVNSLLRRSRPAPAALELPPFLFDFDAMVFARDGVPLELSKTEQRLLRLLVEHRGQTLSREVLLDRVWDGGEFVDENALSVAVNRLRAKLADAPIRTVYGLGYQWAVD